MQKYYYKVFFVFPSSISVFPLQITKRNIEMKTKIPPPILAVVMIGLIYLSSLFIVPTTFNYQGSLSILVLILCFACALPSFKFFAKFNTTISPLKPSDSTALVTEVTYRYSRNPMYLGVLLLTIASTIWFGTWSVSYTHLTLPTILLV